MSGCHKQKSAAILALIAGMAIARVGRAQDLDYAKFESLFGETVTMSATGKPERLSDTPVLMSVITAADIARSGARDIPTLLGRLAGINLVHSSTSSSVIGIGGYADTSISRVMVLVNGQQYYFDGFSNVFWSSLPVELTEIRQIEVIRGAQSALYGFNAVDGVINIITFDPAADRLDRAQIQGGSQATRDVSASVTQPVNERSGIRVTVADDHAHDSGLVVMTPGQDHFAINPERRSLSLDGEFSLADESRIGIAASHTDATERSINNVYYYDARIVTNSIKSNFTANSDLGRFDSTAYYTVLDVPWARTGNFPTFAIEDHTAVLQLSDLFKLSPVDSFRLGVEGRRDSANAGVATDGTLTNLLGSGSFMWEHRFSDDLSMVNAARYDYQSLKRRGPDLPTDLFTNADFDRSVDGLSGNSAVIARLDSDNTVRLSVARGLQLPSLDQLGEVQHATASDPLPGFIFGNPALRTSVVYDEQLGFEHRFDDGDSSAGLTLFHDATMKHTAGRTILIRQDGLNVVYGMSAGSLANGVELTVQHKAAQGWSWGANATYERLHQHAELYLDDGTPTKKINANIGYGWQGWELDLYGTAVGGLKGKQIIQLFPGPELSPAVKDYVSLAPRLGWHPREYLTVELSSDNLWAYYDTPGQRMPATYWLSVSAHY